MTKGALELSVNTIVVIVVGVVLLTLALVFVRGLFTDFTSTKDDVFARIDAEISSIQGSTNQLLTSPTRHRTIEAGEDDAVGVLVKNIADTPLRNVLLAVVANDDGVICHFPGRSQPKEQTIPILNPGETDTIYVFIKTTNAIDGLKSCTVTLNNIPNEPAYQEEDTEIELLFDVTL